MGVCCIGDASRRQQQQATLPRVYPHWLSAMFHRATNLSETTVVSECASVSILVARYSRLNWSL